MKVQEKLNLQTKRYASEVGLLTFNFCTIVCVEGIHQLGVSYYLKI